MARNNWHLSDNMHPLEIAPTSELVALQAVCAELKALMGESYYGWRVMLLSKPVADQLDAAVRKLGEVRAQALELTEVVATYPLAVTCLNNTAEI